MATLKYKDPNTGIWTVIAGGVSDHGALTGLEDDDHPQYLNTSRVIEGTNITIDTTTTPGSVIINSTASGGVTDHGALSGLSDNDHPQYQLTSAKDAANGYAGLDSGTKIVIGQIPTGTSGTTVSLGNHNHDSAYLSPSEVLAGDDMSVDLTTTVGSAILNPKLIPSQLVAASRKLLAAQAGVATANVAIIGDSSVEGDGTSSWYNRVPVALGKVIGETGRHIVFGKINTFSDHPVTFAGNAGTAAQDGSEGRGWAGRNAVIRDGTGSITFTFTGDSFDLHYVQYSGGPTLQIAIDGNNNSLDTSNATTNRFAVWNSGALTYGSHTVVITRTSGSSYGYVNGARVYRGDSTAGVRVWDGGHAGYTTADYAGLSAQWQYGITQIQPDLLVFSIGGNDLSTGRTPSAAVADLTTLVTTMQGLCTVSPNVIVTLLSKHGSTTQVDWDAMAAAFKAAAVTNGWYWLDTTAILPSPGTTGSLYGGDNIHLTSAGQAVHAKKLIERTGVSLGDNEGINQVTNHVSQYPHVSLSTSNPVALGSASAGSATTSSKSDHVHPTTGLALTGTTITAGAGLTGGGDLSANRTLTVGAGTGITVNADDIAVNRTTVDTWYEAAGAVATHAAASDPHTGYQKESEKDAANGYAGLDSGTKIVIGQIPTGTSGTTVALGNHGHDHGTLTGLGDDDHTIYALHTVAASKPGSPRTGEIWIPS